MESIAEAEAGFRFYLEVGGAAAGFAVHLGIGAGFGALFALLARALRPVARWRCWSGRPTAWP